MPYTQFVDGREVSATSAVCRRTRPCLYVVAAVGAALFGSSIGASAQSGSAPPADASAHPARSSEDVFRNILSAHSNLTSYRNTAGLYKNGDLDSVGRFLFDRSQGLKAEVALHNPKPAVMDTLVSSLRCDPNGKAVRFFEFDGPEQSAGSLDDAFGQVFSVSQAWHLIPLMLLPRQGEIELPYAASPVGTATEVTLEGVDCLRIELEAPLANICRFILWVDAKTYLIRQVEENRGEGRPTWRLVVTSHELAPIPKDLFALRTSKLPPLSSVTPNKLSTK